jgi:hypothetical protein
MADKKDVSSAKQGVVVTAHASNNFEATRALVVGVAGDVAVVFADGGSAVTVPLTAGIHPISITAIRVTGTTASGFVALY